MNTIAVVYATEESYTRYMIVSMLSIIDASNKKTFYNFYILVEDSFTDLYKRNILKCFEPYKTICAIEFRTIGNVFDNAHLCIDFIKKPTYFRLLIPQLLNEKKCIYIDVDTIICKDLQKLFDVEMGKNYVAGVKAPAYILGDNEEYCRQAMLPDMQQYINAGVLLMNLDQMRKDNIVEKFLSFIHLQLSAQDQDIINSVCYNKIVFLPFEFNVMTKYATWSILDYKNVFSLEELKRAWNTPSIIHYADRIKPWSNLNCIMGEYWWKICRKSCIWNSFYKQISDELLFGTIYSANIGMNADVCKRTAVLFDILYKRKIIIFGAGNKAIKFIRYLKKHGIIPEFIMVSNSNDNPKLLEGIRVRGVSEVISETMEETIVIATSERCHMKIILLLQSLNYKELVPLSDIW